MEIRQIEEDIQARDLERRELANGMSLLVNMLQNKMQALQDREVSINRHKKEFSPLFDRLYDRIDGLAIGELSKYKNKTDSELLNSIKQLVNGILTQNNKTQPLK